MTLTHATLTSPHLPSRSRRESGPARRVRLRQLEAAALRRLVVEPASYSRPAAGLVAGSVIGCDLARHVLLPVVRRDSSGRGEPRAPGRSVVSEAERARAIWRRCTLEHDEHRHEGLAHHRPHVRSCWRSCDLLDPTSTRLGDLNLLDLALESQLSSSSAAS